MNIDSNAPLGVFDSGVGGLTVVRALRELLPNESIVYLGDTARLPYGSKSPETIRRFAEEDTRFLLSHGVKAVIVACNTATAHALPSLQQTFRIPIIGVVEPGVEATLANSNCKRVGIIGTAGTIRSRAYQDAIEQRGGEVTTRAQATPLLVPFVEEGWTQHPAMELVLRDYLKPLLDDGIDTLVLGCTHYPLLVETLRKIIGPNVRLVDSASTCASHVKVMLEREQMLRDAIETPQLEIHLTDYSPLFETQAKRFLGIDFGEIKKASL